jgi:hypothetical protein
MSSLHVYAPARKCPPVPLPSLPSASPGYVDPATATLYLCVVPEGVIGEGHRLYEFVAEMCHVWSDSSDDLVIYKQEGPGCTGQTRAIAVLRPAVNGGLKVQWLN